MITKREDIEDGPSLSRAEFWQRAAAFSFGAWALAVPIAALALISTLSSLASKFEVYVLVMEKRVTLLEERQNRVMQNIEQTMREMREHEQRLDRVENSERRPR